MRYLESGCDHFHPVNWQLPFFFVDSFLVIRLTGHFPFHSKSPRQTYQLIQAGKFSWGEYEDKVTAEGTRICEFVCTCSERIWDG